MRRIALLLRKQSSDWISCKSITRNLGLTYEHAFSNSVIQTFQLDPGPSLYNIKQEAKKLNLFKPDLIALIDHDPDPSPLLRAYTECLNDNEQPRLHLHVFGDFPLRSPEWLKLTTTLTRFKTLFLCASDAQTSFIQQFIQGSVIKFPFPISAETFFYEPNKSPNKIRTFLYSGRLSYQKNIVPLINGFLAYNAEINPHSQLLLAGPIDDLGQPYLGRTSPNGLFLTELMKKVHLTGKASPAIHYLGNLTPSALRSALNTADTFVSLSTHNDEDFGMAPVEALSCGCPTLLTAWAGYKSLASLGEGVAFIPPILGDSKIQPSVSSITKGLIQSEKQVWSTQERAALSKKTLDLFSIAALSPGLSELTQKPQAFFSGFTPLFSEIAQQFRNLPHAPFKDPSGFSPLYRKAYRAYF